MTRGGLTTNLLGRTLIKGDGWNPGDMQWKRNDPDLNGNHHATILAAWVEEGSVKVLVKTPRDYTFETWVTLHRVQ